MSTGSSIGKAVQFVKAAGAAPVVNGCFWLDGHNLGHGGRIVFRRHRALLGRSGARLQRVTLSTRPRRVRQKLDN